jgi:hypothetical protein
MREVNGQAVVVVGGPAAYDASSHDDDDDDTSGFVGCFSRAVPAAGLLLRGVLQPVRRGVPACCRARG